LLAEHGASKVFGMMPHPEVAARPIDDPDYSGPDFLPQNRHLKMMSTGDGVRFFKKLLETEGV
jgi:phosphoribosylformylglycinamidine (FGAM) synthase-like amidotransferase family enzyme